MPASVSLPQRLRRLFARRGGGMRMAVYVLAAVLAVLLSRSPEAREMSAGWQISAAVFIWALGCAAASLLPLGGFVIAAAWLAWHAVLLGAVWAGGPVIALPVWGLLFVMLWKTAAEPANGRRFPFYCWILLALACGWITAGPCGFNRFTGWTGPHEMRGNLVLGLLHAAAGVWLQPRLRRMLTRWSGPSPAWVFTGAALLMGAVTAGSVRLDLPGAAGWAGEFLHSLESVSGLVWLWLGGGFALALLHPAEACTRRFIRAVSLRRAVAVLPLTWSAVTLVEWLCVRRNGGSLRSFPAALAELPAAADAHAWAGVVILVTGAGFLWQGREGVRLMPRLNAVWLASFAALLAVTPALSAAAFPDREPPPASAVLWPAIVVLAALLRPPPLRGDGGLRFMTEDDDDAARRRAVSGLALLLVFGLLLALQTRGRVPWENQACPAVLLGLLHLAPPRAFYGWWRRSRPAGPPLTGALQAWLSIAGVFTALPLLHRAPDSPAALAAGPVLWLPVLLWLRWKNPRLDMASGAAAGALLAGGMLAAWVAPGLLLPEIPVFSFLNAPAALSGIPWNGPARPLLEPLHFTLLLLLLCAGALLGGLLFRRHPPAGEIPVALPANAA